MMCSLKYAASTKLGRPGKLQVNLKLPEERIIIVKERPRLFFCPDTTAKIARGCALADAGPTAHHEGYPFETHQKRTVRTSLLIPRAGSGFRCQNFCC